MLTYSPGSFTKHFYVYYYPEPILLQILLVWSSLQGLPSLAGTPGLPHTYLYTQDSTAGLGEDEVQSLCTLHVSWSCSLVLAGHFSLLASFPWPVGHLGDGAKRGS